jgi:hypothetical protein
MRNVWKGLVIGALVGSGIGLALDIAAAVGRKAKEVGGQARESLRQHGPEVAEALAAKAADVTERVKQADIPGRVGEMAQHVAESPQARAVVEGAHAAGEAIKDATKRVADVVSENIPEIRHGG